MKKAVFFFSFVFLFANYDNFFKLSGDYFNIDPLIIKTIAIIESDLKSNAINVNTNSKNYYKLIKFLKNENIKYKFYNKKMVSFLVNKKNYIKVLNFLNNNHYSFDIGIMQINSSNTKTLLQQKLLINNPFYNIYLGSKILRECFERSKDAYYTISCYNTGSSYKLRKEYLKKFFDKFKKIKN